MADDVWLWVCLRDRQGKHWGNKYCMGTAVAEGQRDALSWTDLTLSTSYNMCHEWTSPMNKCTGRIKYAFLGPSVMVFFFFMLWYVLPPLTKFDTFVFSHYEQVYRTEKLCISRPMFIGLFLLFWWVLPDVKDLTLFFTTMYNLLVIVYL